MENAFCHNPPQDRWKGISAMRQAIVREHIFQFLWETYHVKPEYLWEKYPEDAIFRNPTSQKWFALFMEVSGRKIGFHNETCIKILNVKCDPQLLGSLLLKPGFFPAYHMNKLHWLTILLNGTVTEDEIFLLLDTSYTLTKKK